MTIDELERYYGNWAGLMRLVNMSHNTYQRWKRLGYIPFSAQCKIENKTNGLFKALESDGRPALKKFIYPNSERNW